MGVPDDVVAAVGRITMAAGDLELALAATAAIQTGANAFEILAKPGEALRAARRAIDRAPALYRGAYRLAVDDAAGLLAKRHTVVHASYVG